jgi:hypothetical protein
VSALRLKAHAPRTPPNVRVASLLRLARPRSLRASRAVRAGRTDAATDRTPPVERVGGGGKAADTSFVSGPFLQSVAHPDLARAAAAAEGAARPSGRGRELEFHSSTSRTTAGGGMGLGVDVLRRGGMSMSVRRQVQRAAVADAILARVRCRSLAPWSSRCAC